jgi:hypothetical protein
MAADLPIIQKTYDLIKWYVPILNQLPRDQRFQLGDSPVERLRQRMVVGLGFCHRFGHLRPLMDSSCEPSSSKALFHKDYGVLGTKLTWPGWPKR